jgi:hypothetical protein
LSYAAFFATAAMVAIMMPNGDKLRRSSSHAEPKENPDKRLRLELLRIAEGDYEEPGQKINQRNFAIAERLGLELPRLTDLARVPPDPGEQIRQTWNRHGTGGWKVGIARDTKQRISARVTRRRAGGRFCLRFHDLCFSHRGLRDRVGAMRRPSRNWP